MLIFRSGHCWKQPSVIIHGCRYTGGPSHQGEALPEKTQMGRPLTEEPWVRVSRPSWWAKLITSSRDQAHAKGGPILQTRSSGPNVLKQGNNMCASLDNGRIVQIYLITKDEYKRAIYEKIARLSLWLGLRVFKQGL